MIHNGVAYHDGTMVRKKANEITREEQDELRARGSARGADLGPRERDNRRRQRDKWHQTRQTNRRWTQPAHRTREPSGYTLDELAKKYAG